ncbi:aspartate aminotransferase family protein [Nocardia sp. CDC159]|uniref:Aspartate aminotransferase family protein n=1 Tax=Nocardia pulmonis TaxID=2951408 RepID=A0A9X2IZ42_9NOCA|nr:MULTISPECIES: aspartate aminotransferase family protein [Nocardia]MCM6775615.1 aspartate aminotransferase family protein [Nocardia pulmonis]MCM6787651.1 aspartate aminotransferase family protein [Nocardia sp. CDC159]
MPNRAVPETESTLWHGFTNMRGFRRRGISIAGADGVWVTDNDGNRYLNAFAGLCNLSLGGSHPEIVAAIREQAGKLLYFPIERATHHIADDYARRLTGVTPEGLNIVFYASTGSEANETVIKMMRQYQRLRRGPDTAKLGVVALDRAYHGVTYGALSATGSAFRRFREQFEPLLPGFHHAPTPYAYRCAFDCANMCTLACADAVEAVIERVGADRIAGVLVEPALGVGGAIVPTAAYHRRLREICDRHDILLAYDEVITGFGRLGEWFGADYFGVRPDFMALSKGINSGYLPFGAVVVRDEIYREFLTEVDGFIATGSTTNGNPLCCAAALATLDIMERDGIVDHAREMGKYLFDKFENLREYPIVGDIRGAGLLMGIELVRDRRTKEPIPKQQWQVIEDRIALAGLIMGSQGAEGLGGTIGIVPPLTITRDEIDEIYRRLDGVLARYSRLTAKS